ncbi:DUF302 domain-containing protein [Planktothrix mougeotii]|uniref:DUF302 domain-containing protein n=1 Tax=Planktothrix mougeotii LEGE 06226 TaxID=1828728 RepID=A0ABR9UCR0_9CYAN|nr:DUF302 domain-containing protein [Planktothrix mougeotii]MBE9144257.1 DUF302 domain-containing protein [Planktothrix mougeotii LEGE 06226]
METINFTVNHVKVSSEKSFAQVTTAIESMVGKANNLIFQKLIDANASFTEVENAVKSMVGKNDLMIFTHLESGKVLSLCGKFKQAKLYIIGNPLIANQMFEEDPAVGLYVPLRLFVYDEYNGKTYITYDQPSSLLGRFENPKILRVAEMLDQKLQELVTMAVQ